MMKKRSTLLFLYGLALMFAMNNCQRIEEPLKSEPSAKLMKEMSDISMKPLVPVEPQAVVVTPFTITTSELTVQFRKDLLSNSSATLPASLQKLANDVSAAVSESDLQIIANADLKTIGQEGKLSSELQGALDRFNTHPALAPYRATSTLPSVGEVVVPKIVIKETVLTTTFSSDRTSSACTDAANNAFLAQQTLLDNQRQAQLAALNTAYNQAVVDANNAQTACKNGVQAQFDAMRAAAQANTAAEIAAINGNPRYSIVLKRVFIAFAQADLRDELATIGNMQQSAAAGCNAIKQQSINAAAAARVAGQLQVQDNFNAAIVAATAVRTAAIADCIYLQGQGS